MNSRQGSRYIKTRMGNELKHKILAYNGIISENEMIKKPSVLTCPRCDHVNAINNQYCSNSKCSYPLKPEAYEEIKRSEEDRIRKLEEKYNHGMNTLRVNMEQRFQQLIAKIDMQKIIE
jgi:integrase/recombinase XerD